MPHRRLQDLPFDKIRLETLERIYVGGGEPTIMPEFTTFLQKCIKAKKTDFELCIGTNGMKFSNKLIDLLSNFSDVVLSISFDGYKKVNDYIRWKSDFDTIHRNAKMMSSFGHKIGLQTVPSMYNITTLHELFEFYDQEFPDSSCLVQAATTNPVSIEPWYHPRPDLVVASMEKCFKTNTYLANGRSCQGYVEGLHAFYSNPDYRVNLTRLKEFFEYNDQLDHARGSRLVDYIPELEDARKLIINLKEAV
jgi:MoaA/NifB/PqqE/SkfB family radical SAM enzyme